MLAEHCCCVEWTVASLPRYCLLTRSYAITVDFVLSRCCRVWHWYVQNEHSGLNHTWHNNLVTGGHILFITDENLYMVIASQETFFSVSKHFDRLTRSSSVDWYCFRCISPSTWTEIFGKNTKSLLRGNYQASHSKKAEHQIHSMVNSLIYYYFIADIKQSRRILFRINSCRIYYTILGATLKL